MWQKVFPYKKNYHITRMMLTMDLKNKTFLRETGTKFWRRRRFSQKKNKIRAVQTFFHWVYQSSYSRQKIYSKQRKAHDWKLISEQHDTKDIFFLLYKNIWMYFENEAAFQLIIQHSKTLKYQENSYIL